ncbi:MAG TPA: sulfotransferase [Myxococcota bacterium]|nr:sulfotransferase [Myxococcota bacterium]
MGSSLRFAFLVYLGRSGSTFLSRQLDAVSRDLLVTPELNFIVTAARMGDTVIRSLSPDGLVRLVRQDLQIANLGLADDELDACVRACAGRGVRELCETLVLAHARKRGREPRVVVVKKSVAHLAADALLRAFPEATFIHVRRDGRAVVNSLIHTESVYDPGHMLGRGDPVHAARLWVRQLETVERLAQREPGRVLDVAYERLVRDPARSVEELRSALAARLGVELRDPAGDAGFLVPERERPVHALVSGPAVEARAEGWRGELGRANGIAVEAIEREWLWRCGYLPHFLRRASRAEVARARLRLHARHLSLTLRHVAWRSGIVLRLLFHDRELARARVREALFQRFG